MAVQQIQADRLGRTFRFEPIGCPTCERDDVEVFGYRGGASHRYELGIRTRIVQCRGCGLIFPNPFPFPCSPSELYGDPDKYFKSHNEAEKIQGSRALVHEVIRQT